MERRWHDRSSYRVEWYIHTWYIDTYIEIDTAWRFQRRVNKKKVVFIEYGDCVIIAAEIYDKPACARDTGAQSRMSPALVYVGHFLIWSDRPILCPESVVASRDPSWFSPFRAPSKLEGTSSLARTRPLLPPPRRERSSNAVPLLLNSHRAFPEKHIPGVRIKCIDGKRKR